MNPKGDVMVRHERHKGLTFIEVTIVMLIILIIAGIVIPNLLDALQKAKQKKTVADMRNTGTAWMSWLTDQVGTASAGSGQTWNGVDTIKVSYLDIFGDLHPSDTFFYMQEVPQTDGWGFDYCFCKNPNLLASNLLAICSSGRDGVFDQACCGTLHDVGPFVATDYNRDIIWADGYFLQWAGMRQVTPVIVD